MPTLTDPTIHNLYVQAKSAVDNLSGDYRDDALCSIALCAEDFHDSVEEQVADLLRYIDKELAKNEGE